MKRLGLVLLAAASPAAADNVPIGAFSPTPSTVTTGFQLETPEVGANGDWVASTTLSYASNLLVIDASTMADGAIATDHPIASRWMASIGGAYAFLDRYEVGLAMPMYSQSGDNDAMAPLQFDEAKGRALGDLAITGKAHLLHRDPWDLGVSGRIALPTATAGQYTGSDRVSGRIMALAHVRPGPRLDLTAAAGAALRFHARTEGVATISQGSGFAFALGANFRVTDHVWIDTELFGEVVATGRDELANNQLDVSPVELLAGAMYRNAHVSLGLAIGRGVSTGVGSPDLRGVFTISVTGDAATYRPLPHAVNNDTREVDPDHDNVFGDLDRCPLVAEDRDGWKDDDGCPDPDNDGDGIADAADHCPNTAETMNGVEDTDGCPDEDSDGDGIIGAADKCPDAAETVNGVADDDGCPDAGGTDGVAVGDGSPTKAAEATFDQGRKLMGDGKYREACTAFEQSQRLDPQFGTQFNLAGCYEKLGKLASAYNLYRELARSDSNADRRTRSTELTVALAARVPKIKLVLVTRPPDVQIFMNDVNANALIGIETPVDFGTFTIAVGATGYRGFRKSVDIREAAKVTVVTIELEKI